jgi:transcriptional regulator with XRE-family HTH domain
MASLLPSQNWYSMSDPAIVTELCHSLKQIRLQQNLTQEQLAEKAGLSRSAISEMENGKTAVSLITIIQLLRALQQLHLLDNWKVSANASPLQVAKYTAKGRLRSSGKVLRKKVNKEKSEW